MKRKIMLISAIIIVATLVVVHFFASRTLEFNEEIIIEVNIDDAWEVIGNQFTEPHKWSANFISSKPGGQPKLDGLTYLYRETTTVNGDNWQELDSFDKQNHSFTYHVSKGLPAVAKSAIGQWKLKELSATKTKLTVDFFLETKGLLGLILSPVLKKKIGNSSAELTEELKYYLETGEPHPRKLDAMKTKLK